MSLENKQIIIGVTGGIALYKTCSLVRLLMREGARVRVVMTEAAARMISPLTFQALSGSEVLGVEKFTNSADALSHVNLGLWGDAFIIAPATANTLGKIANGLADNFLTSAVMAFPATKPLILAPSMNKNMWNNPFVQDNLRKLERIKNYHIIAPEEGLLANRSKGKGRLPDIHKIFEETQKLL